MFCATEVMCIINEKLYWLPLHGHSDGSTLIFQKYNVVTTLEESMKSYFLPIALGAYFLYISAVGSSQLYIGQMVAQ